MSAMHHQPDGPAFDIVLLLHVGCVVVGLVTTATAAAMATRLRRLLPSPVPLPEPGRRSFRPGGPSTATPRPCPVPPWRRWCCSWPGSCSWWRNPDGENGTGPPEGSRSVSIAGIGSGPDSDDQL